MLIIIGIAAQEKHTRTKQTGLRARNVEYAEFTLELRLLLALAFVSPNNVNDACEQRLGSEFYTHNANMLVPLLNYFEDA